MTVEVEDVVVPPTFPQMLAQSREARRTQDVDVDREFFLVHEVDQRPRQRPEIDVVFIGTGGDEEDVDAVARQLGGERRWPVEAVEAAFDLGELTEGSGPGPVQRLPRPREDAGVAPSCLAPGLAGLPPLGKGIQGASASWTRRRITSVILPGESPG